MNKHNVLTALSLIVIFIVTYALITCAWVGAEYLFDGAVHTSKVDGILGTINKTYSLTAAQRTTLLKAMANLASFKATFELTSYDGKTQIGDVSAYQATIRTLAENSKPTFSGFTFTTAVAYYFTRDAYYLDRKYGRKKK